MYREDHIFQRGDRFIVRFYVSGKTKQIGTFRTEEAAIAARNAALKLYPRHVVTVSDDGTQMICNIPTCTVHPHSRLTPTC